MINALSILIPTYNNVCVELVKSLQAQAIALPKFKYEILVADDGSTLFSTIKENRIINQFTNCQYIERGKNVGRAVIRNFLAQQAKYPWLLFIDSNMNVINPQYLSNYQQTDIEGKDVIYGGYQIKRDALTREQLKNNLRYIFEYESTQNGNYKERQANPYSDFHTSNFVVKRDIILNYPFDERFFHYGYEDVLWGKTLKDNHISIEHIDNTLGYEHFINNEAFINKTEESLQTLYQFRTELTGYSKIIDYALILKRHHLYSICTFIYTHLHQKIKLRLIDNKNSIFLFNIYKLLYYIHLDQ